MFRPTFTAKSGRVYTYEVSRQTRIAYAEFMNPDSIYEAVYYNVDIFSEEGEKVSFTSVTDENDLLSIEAGIDKVDRWHYTPHSVRESISSRFD
jgi:hypothetical protein